MKAACKRVNAEIQFIKRAKFHVPAGIIFLPQLWSWPARSEARGMCMNRLLRPPVTGFVRL